MMKRTIGVLCSLLLAIAPALSQSIRERIRLGADHPADKDCHEFRIPAFNGLAQLLVQSSKNASALTINCTSADLQKGQLSLTAQ